MGTKRKFPERKHRIVKTAEKIFAEKGFYSATISEIAKAAEVSDPTIYEYFSNKEQLLFAVPEEATAQGIKALKSILQYHRGAANKLRAFIYYQFLFYQNNPDWASVVLLILKQYRGYLKTPTYKTIRKWSRIIIEIVREGIDSGEFKADVNPYIVRTVVLGAIEHAVISHLLLGRYGDLRELVDPITDMIIFGIRKEPGQENVVNVRFVMVKGSDQE
ncbi:MAG: TetR/AcrR family transcriptional regulator [Deltaproteobacteria bacterium]|nr:TetR/AcrR family transcriptional regulator [Deltaproteobacteria bacterium]